MPRGIYDRSKMKKEPRAPKAIRKKRRKKKHFAPMPKPTEIQVGVSNGPIVVRVQNGNVLGTFEFGPDGVIFKGKNAKQKSPNIAYKKIGPIFEAIGGK